ncbi:hypothetical protein EAF04_008376 [Stromatinia cepivora]|nr:hypothetical protein EAF04_008376 [Stromatinia cepivora]
MHGGIRKRTSIRVRDPATGRFRPQTKPRPNAQPNAQPPNPSAVRIQAQESNLISKEQHDVLVDKLYSELKLERSKFKRRENEIKRQKREVARLTEYGEDVDRQMQELEDRLEDLEEVEEQNQELEKRVEYLDEIEAKKKKLESRAEQLEDMVWEHGLGGNSDLQWSDSIRDELQTAFQDRRSNCYTKVRVLIVRWASDDLGVSQEMSDLASVFKHSDNFEVARYKIPDVNPINALLSHVLKFIGDNSPDTLLIFSYHGHGGFHDTRHDHIWYATTERESPCMPSSGIQTLLEESESDAILFYDTCHSADTAMTLSPSAGSVTELIAACGFQTTAPGVGNNSFTSALIRELSSAAPQEALSVSELYNRVLARLRNTRNREKNTTPIHCTLISDGDRTSIMLEPLSPSLATTSHQASEKSDDEDIVHHIGLVQKKSDRLHAKGLLKWLLKAPSSILDIELNHIQRRPLSDDG